VPASLEEADSLARLSLILALAAPLLFFVSAPFHYRGAIELALVALVIVAPFAAVVVAVMALARFRAWSARGVDRRDAPERGPESGRWMAWVGAGLGAVEIVLLGLVAAWLWAFSNFVF
jgi:hypothetical protein